MVLEGAWARMGILIRSYHRDVKWIAKWFKQVNNSASKSKLQTTMGCLLSKSQTATAAATAVTPPPTRSIDGSNHVKSGNLATSSGTGTSPSLFGNTLEHTFLLSRSGGQVAPENGRSATTGHGPYHSRLQSSGWELEHPTVAPDLQANRELEHPLFYPYSLHGGANPATLPQSHTDLVEHSQLTDADGIVTNNHVYLTSHAQAQASFNRGTSSPNTGTGMDNVKSGKPYSSPSPASAPSGRLQTRYVYVNLVSEAPNPASQAQGVPDFVAPAGSQLGPSSPSEPSAPLPSMYWLLFDTELDSVVDRERGDDVVSRSSSRSPSDRMIQPHASMTPTPISFLAKWEDMLALERRIRSSSRNMKSVQSKQIQAVHAVRANRTRQLTGTGQSGLFCCPLQFFFPCRVLMHGQSRPRLLWSKSRSLYR